MCSPSTFDVRYLAFFNTSYVRAENVEKWFNLLLKIEIGGMIFEWVVVRKCALLIVFSWLGFMYMFYLFFCIRAMHFNLTFLFINYSVHCSFSLFSRFLIIYQQLGMDPNDNLKSLIYYANYIRTIGLFVAMHILPIFMVERCVATFLVENYEKSRKPWVSLVILSIFYPLVFASAISYNQCRLPVIFHVFLIFISNIIGFIGIQFCFSYNTTRYRMFQSIVSFAKLTYGLSERFQLAENIKMCKILKKVQISITFFNVGSSLILMMDHFEIHLIIRYWSYIAFNYFILAYGILGPICLYQELPEWQKETRRLLNLCFRRQQQVQDKPKSTFGEQMIYNDPCQETRIYFNQFEQTTKF